MKDLHNPFTMLSSENIKDDELFLKLFSSDVMQVIPYDAFGDKVKIFRSGPGGGKTSIFRIFRPQSLIIINNQKEQEEYTELANELQKREVISENGPKLLGIYLRLNDYSDCDDLPFNSKQKEKIFFSLIGTRLILKTIKGIQILKNLETKELKKIKIKNLEDADIGITSIPCNGLDLYCWASKLEREICSILYSFVPKHNENISCFNGLEFLKILSPQNFLIDEKPIISNSLLMLDDLHELRPKQRQILLEKLILTRYPLSIWLSERLETLELEEIFPGQVKREYDIVHLEDYWEYSQGIRFEKFAKAVANKRAKMANTEFDITLFEGLLQDTLNIPDVTLKFQKIADEIHNRLKQKPTNKITYDKWIKFEESKNNSSEENALRWKSLEIQIAREENNTQSRLVDLALPIPEKDIFSNLKSTANFFIHDEFKMPYFYGMSTICKLSTSNIELFLEIASDIFEEVISKKIMKKYPLTMTANRQESIIKKVAKTHWNEIPKRLTNGNDAIKLLQNIGKFAIANTMKPNAPYAPGVTGIAISTQSYKKLIDPEVQKKNFVYKRLADTLQSCLSHNYLKPKYDSKQGKSGSDTVVVLYLNRLLCAHFGLPIGYGGWRKKTPDELCNWIGIKKPENGRITL